MSPISPSVVVTVNPLGSVPEGIDPRYADLFAEKNDFLEEENGTDLRLRHIVQLALGSKPYTRSVKHVFDTARKTEAYSTRWLGIRGYTAIIVAPVIATVLSFLAWDSITGKPLSDREKLIIAVCLASLAVAISGFLGVKFTGTNPKATSDEQNRDQIRMLLKVLPRMDECAKHMIYAYKTGDEPLKILLRWAAKNIDVDEKVRLLGAASTQDILWHRLEYLDAAIRYVKEGVMPPFTDLERLVA